MRFSETESAPGRRLRRSYLLQFRVEHQDVGSAEALRQHVRRIVQKAPAKSVVEMGKRFHRQRARQRVRVKLVSATVHPKYI